MVKCDYHVHSTYCDGKASLEEMVIAAIEKGMTEIGFSGHARTSRDETWCMSDEKTKQYIAELKELREKYAGRINIRIGAEQDYFSDGPMDGFEYRIGSVHYVELGGRLCEIDDSADDHYRIAEEFFGGDLMALAECYYETEGDVIRKTGADIIGHFSLIEKFNEDDALYDTSSPRYKAAWQNAADKLLAYGKPFEINTGAISRGYRTEPYPSREMIEYIAAHGGKFILSSDSHAAGTLLYGFEDLEMWAKEKGIHLISKL